MRRLHESMVREKLV